MPRYEGNGPMLGHGKLGILQHRADKVTPRGRLVHSRPHDGGAEVGETAIRDDDEVRKERLLLRVTVLARRAHAEDASCELAEDEL